MSQGSNLDPYEAASLPDPHQGSFYRDLEAAVSGIPSRPGEGEIATWVLPYAVVLSQECDLEQDGHGRNELLETLEQDKKAENVDKLVPCVLVCPAWPAEQFHEGQHMERFGLRVKRKTSAQYRTIRQNLDPRYHFLTSWRQLQVPASVIDFKHFFTIPTSTLRAAYGSSENYIALLTCPYREDLSQRFAAFLSRVGVPLQHHSLDSAPASDQPSEIPISN